MYPIVDLHCDLLHYLAWKKGRSPFSPDSRCSHDQLQSGGVKLQTVAISTSNSSSSSVILASKQIGCYKKLLSEYPERFIPFNNSFSSSHIQLLPAIENASGIATEEESLDTALECFQTFIQQTGNFFYISLTWNGENRFGGGAGSSCGLKEDGKTLLKWLKGKNIAIDFSHASDKLAFDILEYNDQNSLNLRFMASHSNFRTITDHVRNLPDALVKELVQRQGLIGLNFIVPFFGSTDRLLLHIEHAFNLGAENILALGADFFCDTDFDSLNRYSGIPLFSKEYPNASCYPSFLSKLTLPIPILNKLSHLNALCFLNSLNIN